MKHIMKELVNAGSGGIYDTLYKCKNCGEEYLISVDGDKLPTESTCRGTKEIAGGTEEDYNE